MPFKFKFHAWSSSCGGANKSIVYISLYALTHLLLWQRNTYLIRVLMYFTRKLCILCFLNKIGLFLCKKNYIFCKFEDTIVAKPLIKGRNNPLSAVLVIAQSFWIIIIVLWRITSYIFPKLHILNQERLVFSEKFNFGAGNFVPSGINGSCPWLTVKKVDGLVFWCS